MCKICVILIYIFSDRQFLKLQILLLSKPEKLYLYLIQAHI